MITHADGTFVSNSSPARVGKTITLYAVGLGFAEPSAAAAPPTGSAPTAPIALPLGPSSVGTVGLSYLTSLSDAGYTMTSIDVPPDWVGLIPGYVGLYQVNFTVPPAPGPVYPPCGPSGNVNLALSAGTQQICVQP